MGCGSSGNVVPAQGEADRGKVANGTSGNHEAGNDESDDLPTVVLPDSPLKAKPPVAFDIPVEEFDGNRRPSNAPPPHLQRLLQPQQPDISLPDIEEKLAEAEQRRLSILQQRAASAQKRTQKMIRSIHDMDTLNGGQNNLSINDNDNDITVESSEPEDKAVPSPSRAKTPPNQVFSKAFRAISSPYKIIADKARSLNLAKRA